MMSNVDQRAAPDGPWNLEAMQIQGRIACGHELEVGYSLGRPGGSSPIALMISSWAEHHE